MAKTAHFGLFPTTIGTRDKQARMVCQERSLTDLVPRETVRVDPGMLRVRWLVRSNAVKGLLHEACLRYRDLSRGGRSRAL